MLASLAGRIYDHAPKQNAAPLDVHQAMDAQITAQFGLFALQVERLRSASALAEGALLDHVKGIDEWYEKRAAELDLSNEKDKAFLEYLLVDQKSEAADAYPQILRASLLSTAYGVFESLLVTLCKRVEPVPNGLRLRDLRGEGIQRTRLYLSKVARLAFPDTDEWKRLVAYGYLRNALVHAQGDLSSNDNVALIRQLAAKAEGVVISDGDNARITLGHPCVSDFLDDAEIFAESLDAAFRAA